MNMIGKRLVVLESAVLLAIALVCIGEGIRLITYKIPGAIYDQIGPGFYVLFLGIAMLITSLAHFIFNRKEGSFPQKNPTEWLLKIKVIMTVGVCAMYVLLINFFGYLMATLVFNLMEFRLAGMKSWSSILIVSLIVSGFYYLVFVYYCNLIFPQGIFF
jgi:putative tricarboxylic transport membrane protein